MTRDNFIHRDDVADLRPLVEYMRAGLWDGKKVAVAINADSVPLFTIQDGELAATLRETSKALVTRSSQSGVFLLSNGLIADIVNKRVRYFSPLYGPFAVVWSERWRPSREAFAR